MIADIALSINDPIRGIMEIDIRPDTRLEPIPDLPASRNPARIYLASLAAGSQPTMRRALDLSAGVLTFDRCDHESLPWWLLRKAHTNALRAWLTQNLSYRTGNKILSAVRGALRAAWDMEQIDTDAYMRAISIKAIKGAAPDQAAGRALSAGELSALLAVCQDDLTPAGPRDAVILGLGARCGLRRAEMAGLALADLDGDGLTIRGKGNKTRLVYVAPGVDGAIADWLAERGRVDGALLLRVRKGGEIIRSGLSDAAIYDAMVKRAQQAGVKAFSPHDLRRTFAGDLLDEGADIATVQKLMGHANANTTAGYDRRGERAKRSAAGRLHLAWNRRS